MATEVRIPDIGDFKDVPIIEVHVKEGDPVNADDPLVSLESDKATMEVPAPQPGTVETLLIKIGDKVSEGTPILLLRGGDGAMAQPPTLVDQQEPKQAEQTSPVSRPSAPPTVAPPSAQAPAPAVGDAAQAPASFGQAHASPSVRRLARELDVDLNKIKGTGERGRITREDVKAFLRGPAAAPAAAGAAPTGGMGIPEIPAQDFSKFGPVETRLLPRIKKISGPHLHRAWLNVPHVNNNYEADITEIYSYRRELDTAAKEKGFRVTLLAFLMKASVSALRQFPDFNASLSPEKDALILKKYYNIGIAVDT
ncbi:MAG: 2-oxo acid dehydrogenase subunit E2, partial [Pseudomonadota bacterium]|nr:2-oxo acid dehydrogenase subunit E2 [Pseudomonadota bacterium]